MSLLQKCFVGELALHSASVFFKAKNIWVCLFLFIPPLTLKNANPTEVSINLLPRPDPQTLSFGLDHDEHKLKITSL